MGSRLAVKGTISLLILNNGAGGGGVLLFIVGVTQIKKKSLFLNPSPNFQLIKIDTKTKRPQLRGTAQVEDQAFVVEPVLVK